MKYIQYEPVRLSKTSRWHVEDAERIIREYAEKGYAITLRQLYWLLVRTRGFINSDKNYKRLVRLVSMGRRAGLIPWIEENETRTFDYDYPGSTNQVELWASKDLGSITESSYWASGYMTDCALWEESMRIRKILESGRNFVILHLGDHDPTGLDMTRHIRERLDLFVFGGGGPVDLAAKLRIKRIGLNFEQIKEHHLPYAQIPKNDTRSAEYRKTYGNKRWELEALEPEALDSLICSEFEPFIKEHTHGKSQEQTQET